MTASTMGVNQENLNFENYCMLLWSYELKGPYMIPKQIYSIPSTVWMLGLVSLFNDISSEMIYPLLPTQLPASEY